MCYLRGDCRPGDFGEPGIDKNGPGAKHEKQEKVRRLIWAISLNPENTIWMCVLFATDGVDCPRTLVALLFAEDVRGLDSSKEKRKSLKK